MLTERRGSVQQERSRRPGESVIPERAEEVESPELGERAVVTAVKECTEKILEQAFLLDVLDTTSKLGLRTFACSTLSVSIEVSDVLKYLNELRRPLGPP